MLLRSIIIRPEEPAVVILGHFCPQIYRTYGYAGPEHWHSVVAQFYDVPHVSTKSLLLPDFLRDKTSLSKYFVDPVLANPAGHEVLTEALIAYFQSQICVAWDVANGHAFESIPLLTPELHAATDGHALFGGAGPRKGVPEKEEEIEAVVPTDEEMDAGMDKKRKPSDLISAVAQLSQLNIPPGMIHTWPGSGDRSFEEIAPYCVSANNLINPLSPSLFVGSGWSAVHPPTTHGPNLHAMAHYWYSSLPTSKIRIPIQVGSGDIGVYYMKEPISGVGEGSSVSCWVDDNVKGAKVIENAANIGEPKPA